MERYNRGSQESVSKTMSIESIFTGIYRKNAWRNSESRSGSGSTVAATEALRLALPEFVARFGIKSFLDLPCGDWNWMRHVELGCQYIGADIVQEVVVDNQQKYGGQFIQLDLLVSDLPKVDVIFCRDCLVHFAPADVRQAIENMQRSGSTYLLTTTFPDHVVNQIIATGQWTPYNLQVEPFNFPEPLTIINEHYFLDFPYNTDKSLGLWSLKALTQEV